MIPLIYIGKDFFDDPSGRYYTDGDGSGEEFREEVLKPLLSKLEKLEINIDENVEGYGSSFLVEAFGGLIKHGYFSKEDVKNKITISCKNKDYDFFKNKIYQYIDEADFNSEKYISSKDEAIRNNTFKSLIKKNFVDEIIKKHS